MSRRDGRGAALTESQTDLSFDLLRPGNFWVVDEGTTLSVGWHVSGSSVEDGLKAERGAVRQVVETK